MTTLERALAVVARYDGVIVKVSGKVGFIDIDKCVREDGALDERAQRILSLLPGAMVEYSPSGRGLHVILFVPEGYIFGLFTESCGIQAKQEAEQDSERG